MSLRTCTLPHRYIICNLRSPHREVKIARRFRQPGVLLSGGEPTWGRIKGPGKNTNHVVWASTPLPTPSPGWQRGDVAKKGGIKGITRKPTRGRRTGCPRVTGFCHRHYDIASHRSIIAVLSLCAPAMIKARKLVYELQGLPQVQGRWDCFSRQVAGSSQGGSSDLLTGCPTLGENIFPEGVS